MAIAAFHTEMLPASFLLSVAVARTGIVIPVALEVLLMALSEDSSSGRRQSKRES